MCERLDTAPFLVLAAALSASVQPQRPLNSLLLVCFGLLPSTLAVGLFAWLYVSVSSLLPGPALPLPAAAPSRVLRANELLCQSHGGLPAAGRSLLAGWSWFNGDVTDLSVCLRCSDDTMGSADQQFVGCL